jgi:hypothetical protein
LEPPHALEPAVVVRSFSTKVLGHIGMRKDEEAFFG